jgi:carboxyl-terminal processing protease
MTRFRSIHLFLVWTFALGLALACPLGELPLARAQLVELAPPIPAHDDLAVFIEKGARLEKERQWAEALTHWEQIVREHPERIDLKQRAVLARAHYDVSRRYGDASYTSALERMTDREALSIYDEVLLKIQANYVQQPRWQDIVYSGLTNLEAALAEPAFTQKNLANLSASTLSNLQRELRSQIAARSASDRQQALAIVDQVGKSLEQQFGLASQAVTLEFASGAISSLDEYSGFLTGSQMDEVFSQIEGNFVGLGIELKTEPTGLLIVSLIPGGPAALGGLQAGERIVAVDRRTTTDATPDALADMLRGVEGSVVEVVVQDALENNRTLRLTRRRVEVPSVVDVKVIDREAGIGYFKLTSFQKTTSRDVEAALWSLRDQGMQHLIVDVRGNPGGLLKAAVDVADKFVMDGMIVATRGRSAREDFDHRGQISGTWRVPLVVLIDHDSASASEIFAGAIRDHRRGTIVGVKSYGKGSVQGIFPLAAANVGVRLTTAKWYTPAGQAISGAGVTPDVEVKIANRLQSGTDKPVVGEDSILAAGIKLVKDQQTARRTP